MDTFLIQIYPLRRGHLLNKDTFFHLNGVHIKSTLHPPIVNTVFPWTNHCIAGSSGHVMFSGLSPALYTLRVVATNRRPDKEFIKTRFEITDDVERCTLHLINGGVVVSGDSATVEFTGRGPAAGYLCHLDKTQPYICMCHTLCVATVEPTIKNTRNKNLSVKDTLEVPNVHLPI